MSASPQYVCPSPAASILSACPEAWRKVSFCRKHGQDEGCEGPTGGRGCSTGGGSAAGRRVGPAADPLVAGAVAPVDSGRRLRGRPRAGIGGPGKAEGAGPGAPAGLRAPPPGRRHAGRPGHHLCRGRRCRGRGHGHPAQQRHLRENGDRPGLHHRPEHHHPRLAHRRRLRACARGFARASRASSRADS